MLLLNFGGRKVWFVLLLLMVWLERFESMKIVKLWIISGAVIVGVKVVMLIMVAFFLFTLIFFDFFIHRRGFVFLVRWLTCKYKRNRYINLM